MPMRPPNLSTKIFLDSADPTETTQALNFLGFLDGQTTNPTLMAKNPKIQFARKAKGSITQVSLLTFYRGAVEEISALIPNGSVSIEVYQDQSSSAHDLFEQGNKMFAWIPNAHIKYPISPQGLEAAQKSVQNKMRVNMTLCFTQEQAAAVYSATLGASDGDVFLSPFIGRLDDRGQNGIDLIENIVKMFTRSDRHVQTLAASVRSVEHLIASIAKGADIITAPLKILKEWASLGTPAPDKTYSYAPKNLKSIYAEEITLNKPWQEYNISHELTTAGIERFARDWNTLLSPQ